MASRSQQRAHVVDRLAEHLLSTGLSQASLRQLASAAGISDRMLLYYFSDKAEVLAETMSRIAADFSQGLDEVIPAGQVVSPPDLMARLAEMALGERARPMMRLWLEASAAAARHEAPFVVITRSIAGGFIGWIESRLERTQPERRASIAAMILAMVDGLVLLEVCTDEATARAAAGAMVEQLGALT